ncbi:MAG: T9SS C-terminal target domain-containing protein [Bacteroidetes bacterium]|nr:MAG: T9SS C-terminal target domain-containing protein [Bacteroidota bacterium]REK08145.1 MAG: T9SS C-terminal target domain-containing protein [Bacteroidota bacterium]REK32350.1 MAG: T9SS C-terminal target domain-containing protein [Bacteroidota bacterium]REK49584.1 MAG: T9SS C-terminal target domain-containing protein [Bacteroidota bacterium]
MNKSLTLLSVFLFISQIVWSVQITGDITSSKTFNDKVEVVGDVFIKPGVTVVFTAGSALRFGEGFSIHVLQNASLKFLGTSSAPVSISVPGLAKQAGKIEVRGTYARLEMHHTEISGCPINVIDDATCLIEDSYLHDFYRGDIPILRSELAADIQMRRSIVSNYYEVNIINSPSLIEDCLFQFMTADGIDYDNSPQNTFLKRSTFRYGQGFNIDAIDFGKVNFGGLGSMGTVEQCIIHDISDKAVSVGEGALEVNIFGCIMYNCGAGVSIKDNSFARVYNNTMVSNEHGIELVEKNPGHGGGHGYTFNNILWNNGQGIYLNSTATVTIRNSNIEDYIPDPANEIISMNPMFENASLRNYKLRDMSPCIGTGIGGINMGAVFPNGGPQTPDDELHLGYPNSFSSFSMGDTIIIRWSAGSSLDRIDLLFSHDEGSTWQIIAAGIIASIREFEWIIPSVYSSRCYVRAQLTSNPAVKAENYLPFKINPDAEADNKAIVSIPSGYYTSPINVMLSADPGETVYYTLDGSDPDDQSSVYQDPVSFGPDSFPPIYSEQNITAWNKPSQPYSYIRSSPVSHIGPNHNFWVKPNGDVFKAGILRTRVYKPGEGMGAVQTNSYFVHPEMKNGRYSLPVVSIVTDPGNLFDYYNGIYIPGAAFNGNAFTGNYELKGRVSERPVSIEIFEPSGRKRIGQQAGIRIRGEWIRSLGQKAMTVYARQEYDEENTFKIPFFPGLKKPGTSVEQNEFKRFILRNSGNEWGGTHNTMCRDALIQSLFAPLDLKYQAARMSIVFINGEYWGIHDIRELNDHRGLEFSYGVNPDSIIIMEDNLDGLYKIVMGNDGDTRDFLDLRNYILTNDLNLPSSWQYVKDRLDVENFSDYWIATIFTNKRNTDHNKVYWKLRNGQPNPGVKEGHDGRWRYIANDFDNGFYDSNFNNLDFMLSSLQDSMLAGMMRSDEFRNYFLTRFADLLNSAFSPSAVAEKLEEYRAILDKEIDEHIARWGTPSSRTNWEEGMDGLKNFGLERRSHQLEHIMYRFYPGDTIQLHLDVSDPAMGYVQVNTIKINGSLPGVSESVYPWSGTYFSDLEIRLTAAPYPGFKFVGWKDSGVKKNSISFYAASDTSFTALFEWDDSINPASGVMTAFPNPADGNLITLNRKYRIWLYNAEGKLVFESRHETNQIDISGLSEGIYFLRNEKGKVIKVVKT